MCYFIISGFDLTLIHRVNSYFASLCEAKLFRAIPIGVRRSDHLNSMPRVVTEHLKVIEFYPQAFILHPAVVNQVPWTKVVGISCVSYYSVPFWGKLQYFLLTLRPCIVQLRLRIDALSFMESQMEDFTAAMQYLSTTVRIIGLDLNASEEAIFAVDIIKKSFTDLNSIHFLNLDPFIEHDVLSSPWACSEALQYLYLSECNISYSSLSKFLAHMRHVTQVHLDNCIAVERSGTNPVIFIDKNRHLEVFEVTPRPYRAPMNTPNLVHYSSNVSKT
jgi:hypothetical protein